MLDAFRFSPERQLEAVRREMDQAERFQDCERMRKACGRLIETVAAVEEENWQLRCKLARLQIQQSCGQGSA